MSPTDDRRGTMSEVTFLDLGPERLGQIDVHRNGRFTTRWLTDVHSRSGLAGSPEGRA
ncbi:MAG TPA: hypothetical protein VFW18_04910 [Gaiellales bacterium]|nr:hypothetical protein [Gaiellales bacterium]